MLGTALYLIYLTPQPYDVGVCGYARVSQETSGTQTSQAALPKAQPTETAEFARSESSLRSRRAHTGVTTLVSRNRGAACLQSGEGGAAWTSKAGSAKVQTREGILKYLKEVQVLPLKSVSLLLNQSEVKTGVLFC